MDTVASTLSRSRLFHRVPAALGILTMLLLPAVQASEGLCNKVTAPSTQALLSTRASTSLQTASYTDRAHGRHLASSGHLRYV